MMRPRFCTEYEEGGDAILKSSLFNQFYQYIKKTPQHTAVRDTPKKMNHAELYKYVEAITHTLLCLVKKALIQKRYRYRKF